MGDWLFIVTVTIIAQYLRASWTNYYSLTFLFTSHIKTEISLSLVLRGKICCQFCRQRCNLRIIVNYIMITGTKMLRATLPHTVTVKWAFESMAPYKSPGDNGILPALVQHGMQYAVTPICKLYRASLATGYIPLSWRIARVSFIPKPGRLDYTNSKAF